MPRIPAILWSTLLVWIACGAGCVDDALLPDPAFSTGEVGQASTLPPGPDTTGSGDAGTGGVSGDTGMPGGTSDGETALNSSQRGTSATTSAPLCTGLFGVPGPSTGLDGDACAPFCVCGDATWTAPDYDAEDVEALRSWTLLNPPETPETDPYLEAEAWPEQPERFCGFFAEDEGARTYRLETMESEEEVLDAGGRVTHHGACGLCSSLADLAVYIETPELTTPVRACGLLALQESEEASRACIRELGFSEACTEIWFRNTLHTRRRCTLPCLRLLDAPHNLPDGSLNECLQCDEDRSGPVFKGASGRTRRNSGLPSGICRPCGTDIAPLVHEYP